MPETNPGTTGLVYLGETLLADQSGNGGTVTNLTGSVDNSGAQAAIGNKVASYFKASTADEVKLNFTAIATGEYTLSFWVYWDVASYGFPNQVRMTDATINEAAGAYNAKGFAARTNAWGSSMMGVFAQVTYSATSFPVRTWIHFCGQGGSSWLAAYANASLLASRTDRTLAYSPDGQSLGAANGSNDFKGMIAEPSIWSRRLSTDEISWLANPANTLMDNLGGGHIPSRRFGRAFNRAFARAV